MFNGTYLFCVCTDPHLPYYGMLYPMWCAKFKLLTVTGEVDSILSPQIPWNVASYLGVTFIGI